MILRERSAILILSGQGIGNGVDHRAIPLGLIESPPASLIATWASLSDPAIPQERELVLMISRQSDYDGRPWTVLSEYAKANLTGQTRDKHYAGISLAVPECSLPPQAVASVHAILEQMTREIIPGGEFSGSIRDWEIPEHLLAALGDLPVEPLRAGFGGLRPGTRQARIIHHRQDPGPIVEAAQTDPGYSDYAAVIIIQRAGKPAKEVIHINDRSTVDAWETRNTPPPVEEPPAPADRASANAPPGRWAQPPAAERNLTPGQLNNRIKALEAETLQLRSGINRLEARIAESPVNTNGISGPELFRLALLTFATFSIILAAWRYLTSEPNIQDQSQFQAKVDQPAQTPNPQSNDETGTETGTYSQTIEHTEGFLQNEANMKNEGEAGYGDQDQVGGRTQSSSRSSGRRRHSTK